MQEGMLSLMQMAKTASAIAELKREGIPFISMLTDPTTGGVLASFASLADIILAEPEALVGFAGPRVVEQVIGRPLPPGSHTAEFQRAHGMVDAIVSRPEQRNYLIRFLQALHPADGAKPEAVTESPPQDQASAWEIVQRARADTRPSTRDYLQRLSPGYVELHGDRQGLDDPAVVAAIGQIGGIPVGLVGFDRFASSALDGAAGHPLPSGFRKAQRVLELAERWKLPVVSFIDTPGAYPGIEAEESGLAGEIARTLEQMSSVQTPTIAVVVGEGGSGGALALALADRLLMQSGAFFSVISPEGAATILHRDASRAPELATSLRITAPELLELGIVDEIVPEPSGGAASDVEQAAELLESAIVRQLRALRKRRINRLLKARRTRYRTIGMAFIEGQPPHRQSPPDPESDRPLTA